jgi:GTP-binding protein HflX
MIEREAPAQRAIVIHPLRDLGARDPEQRLAEAAGLGEALDLEVVDAVMEPLRAVRPGTYFGPGKVEAIGARCKDDEIDVVILDVALSPVQQRNLERAWNAKVIDRTGLILEIFARRARTKEGRLQVELARLTYEKSRLVRTWTHLERQRGGFGVMGGPGETQIEIDRRLIADKIARLKRELEEVRRTRALHRANRARTPLPIVALVGYTNAGKSTLFNRAAGADVLAKDMPFATLDTTLRGIRLPSGRKAILSDTVGFITDLPTELVAAFRATLEEVAAADVLIHVRDIAHAETEGQKADVEDVLERIEADARAAGDPRPPLIEAWNKADLLDADAREGLAQRAARSGVAAPQAVVVSAATGAGVEALFGAVDRLLAGADDLFVVRLAAGDGKARAWLHSHGEVLSERGDEAGEAWFTVRLDTRRAGQFREQFAGCELRLIHEGAALATV